MVVRAPSQDAAPMSGGKTVHLTQGQGSAAADALDLNKDSKADFEFKFPFQT